MNQPNTLNYIWVTFPAINKNHTLAENDEMIEEKSEQVRCKVKKILTVPPRVYNALGNTFLNDNDIWENIGGWECIDDRYDNLNTLEILERWTEDGRPDVWITSVVLVKNAKTGDQFYVNTEGHTYARYVGR